ncbi:MAG TPA: DUF4258 domain-containing protein, partial [Rhabdochlamydiaceae bacterium]|nr:DUF4258 domain-containing protein [Rhabdochlamydiaceae bacterium]
KNILEMIKKSIHSRNFRFSKHAINRGVERAISFKDALDVLKNGFHNEKKTSFDPRRRIWKYAIEGITNDAIDVRVIVAFESGMVIITIIRLVKKKVRRKS